jgi:hypothetical protein
LEEEIKESKERLHNQKITMAEEKSLIKYIDELGTPYPFFQFPIKIRKKPSSGRTSGRTGIRDKIFTFRKKDAHSYPK